MSDSRLRDAERRYNAEPGAREHIRAFLVALLRAGNHAFAVVTRLVGELTQADRGVLRLPSLAKLNNHSGSCELCGVAFEPDHQAFYLTTLRNEESPLESHSDQGRTAHQLPWDAGSVRQRYANCTCDGHDWTPRGTTKVIRVHEWGCARKGKFWEFVTVPGVWEHLCHAQCAQEHGYQTPRYTVRALNGHRTVGHADREAS